MASGASRSGATIELELESHRQALTGYCYRMLGSGFEAEDAVQETMVRAWAGFDRFEGRSALRSWLYRIATNVCVDMLRGPQRRAQPMDLGPSSSAASPLDAGLPEHHWVQPVPDARVLPADTDPAELATLRDTIRLAFVAALQHLPPRQRAVLILRDVLHWQAAEVAELLDTSVASVNSALQRARATLEAADVAAGGDLPAGDEQRRLLAQYIDAFERYDITALVRLLRDDVEFSMPPFALWLQGPDQVGEFLVGTGAACRGSRVLVTAANGRPAYASYKPSGDGTFNPWALVVMEMSGDRISGLHHFLYPELFPAFGLPTQLAAGSNPAPDTT